MSFKQRSSAKNVLSYLFSLKLTSERMCVASFFCLHSRQGKPDGSGPHRTKSDGSELGMSRSDISRYRICKKYDLIRAACYAPIRRMRMRASAWELPVEQPCQQFSSVSSLTRRLSSAVVERKHAARVLAPHAPAWNRGDHSFACLQLQKLTISDVEDVQSIKMIKQLEI